MTAFQFIHTADLHLGRRFGTLPEERRGRLVEARHEAIRRVASAAWAHEARHILVAGDLFDTETPADHVRRQALAAMGAEPELNWWLLPGNHDSLAAEALWERIVREAPPNVTPILTAQPIELDDEVTLLPAPVTQRRPGRDLTARMAAEETDPRQIRIGLAHGAIQDFDEDGDPATIPPDRARTARLDYLALGDWHGRMRVSDRCHYSGAPEQDGWKHDARGACLAVTIDGPGAVPKVETVTTGTFLWTDEVLPLLPGQDAAAALAALLPRADRRDVLIRIRVEGRASLAEQAALRRALEEAAPDFWHMIAVTDGLATEHEASDLDEIAPGGALRLAADSLLADLLDERLAGGERDVAAAALSRLYGYVKEGGR